MGRVTEFFKEQGITLSLGQEREMLALDKEFESSRMLVTAQQAEYVKLLAEVGRLEGEVERLQKLTARQLSDVVVVVRGDPCPFCLRLAGQLRDLKPDENFAQVGLKRGFYECSNCGKQYEKEMDVSARHDIP